MQTVILAGGLGTRLAEATSVRPKRWSKSVTVRSCTTSWICTTRTASASS